MSSPLVSAGDLADMLASVTVLDIRYQTGGAPGPESYSAGHVPGAAYVDMDAELAALPVDPDGSGRQPAGRHPLPPTDVFESAMRRAGLREDRPVVVYDDLGRSRRRTGVVAADGTNGHCDVRVPRRRLVMPCSEPAGAPS